MAPTLCVWRNENNKLPGGISGTKVIVLRLNFRIIVAGVLLAVSRAQLGAQMADATRLNNKAMAGYQGWFRAPGDHPGSTGWAHWFNSAEPNTRSLAFDTWPEMSEYTANEKYAVSGFTNPDGSQAYLYSAQNYQTVLRHFEWMRTAGIDGVWLSQFCSHMPGGRSESDYPNVTNIMNNVRKAATVTGRTWAFMYDFSGVTPNNVAAVISNQWKRMVDSGITSDPRYLHHDGKPVLLLWGFFPDRRQSDPTQCNPLISFLQDPGTYQACVVGGGEPFWRTTGSAAFQEMLMRMTAWMPWQVGRFTTDPKTGYRSSNTSHWTEDVAMCASNHVMYIPVLYAGTHVAGPPPVPPALPIVPRRNGNLLWEQFVAASKIPGINSVFIAMFDEANEGTEILKVSNTPPTNAPFITFEGATTDWYMRLVGLGETMLKNHEPITMPVPISPFDEKRSYKIANKSNGLVLHPGGASKGSPMTQVSNTGSNASLQWQLIYDGAGYFKIKNRSNGKWMGQGDSTTGRAPVVQSNDATSDNLKWELVWDGTGYCKIKNKTGGKMLSGGGATTNGAPILQVTDANSDDLRWQIQN
jgi:Ricin-type beta-trefoil lectin domain-like